MNRILSPAFNATFLKLFIVADVKGGIQHSLLPMTYAEKLKDPRWQKRRLQIMERDKFTCLNCGSTEKTLNVHHLWYEKRKAPWDYPDECLKTLCEECHKLRSEVEKYAALVFSRFTARQFYTIVDAINNLQIGWGREIIADWLKAMVESLPDLKLGLQLLEAQEESVQWRCNLAIQAQKGENHAKDIPVGIAETVGACEPKAKRT